MPKENSTANLMMIAEQVKAAGNFEEAFNYYSKVLEVDPNNYKAWFGKGECAGSLSTIKTFRLDEMLKYMELSVNLAPNNEKEALRYLAAKRINNIAISYFNLVKEHFHEFKTVSNAGTEYLGRCLKVVEALENALGLFVPTNRDIMENLIFISEDVLKDKKIYLTVSSFQEPVQSVKSFLRKTIDRNIAKIENLKSPEEKREEQQIEENNTKAISKTVLIVVIVIVGFMVTVKMINQIQSNALSEKEARAKILEEEERKEQKIQEEQEENLKKKYREKVKNKLIEEGDSSKVILEMFGKPSKVEKKVVVVTGKQQETWSYYPKPKNSFQLIIFLEDDKVIKWEDKRQK